jgi:hypothetical protein
MAAIAISPATRAIALFSADAMPALRSSASASTVAVSGATTIESPNAKISSAGSRSVQYSTVSSRRCIMTSPTVHTSGPTPMNSRGPYWSARRPKRAESRNITTVTGRVAAPAAVAEKPATPCRNSTSRKNRMLSPPYIANVSMFPNVKLWRRNSASGSIGWLARLS